MDDGLVRLVIGPDVSIIATMQAITRGAREIALVVNEDERLMGTVTDGDLLALCSQVRTSATA